MRWVPVEEKNPEENGTYTVTVERYIVNVYDDGRVECAGKERFLDTRRYYANFGWALLKSKGEHIVAWLEGLDIYHE